jgi:hypothetical protein
LGREKTYSGKPTRELSQHSCEEIIQPSNFSPWLERNYIFFVVYIALNGTDGSLVLKVALDAKVILTGRLVEAGKISSSNDEFR